VYCLYGQLIGIGRNEHYSQEKMHTGMLDRDFAVYLLKSMCQVFVKMP